MSLKMSQIREGREGKGRGREGEGSLLGAAASERKGFDSGEWNGEGRSNSNNQDSAGKHRL